MALVGCAAIAASAPAALGLGLPPLNTGLPTISGTAQEGQTVHCSTGTWLNSPTSYSYTWQRDLSNIASATSSSYTLASADVGHAITCTVVAHKADGDSLPAISAPIIPTAPPPPGAPTNVTAPSISPSSAHVGQAISCSTGTWDNSPTSYAYSWQRDGTDIAGATSSGYIVVTEDVDHQVTCTVIAHNSSGDSAPAVSGPIAPTGSADSAPQNTAPPRILGTAEPNRQLTCSPGSWNPTPDAFAFRWVRNGSVIAGASTSTYTVAVADVGQRIQCRVFASNQAGWNQATSAAVVPADKTPPVVSSFRVTNKRFAVGRKPAGASSKVKRGTHFVFKLSEPAQVTIKIQCVRPQRKAQHRARCKAGGKLSQDGAAGSDRIAFSGRIGNHALKPARYRATIVATDASRNASIPRRAGFVVVRSRHRR